MLDTNRPSNASRAAGRGVLVIAMVAFVAPGLYLLGAHAQEPTPSATSSAAASPSASATVTPSAAPANAPPVDPSTLRSLEKQPPPQEKSERPSAPEWQGGERVALTGGLPTPCEARLVREWLQIHCKASGASVAVVSGSREDVKATLIPFALRDGTHEQVVGASIVELPIRRGDRRILQASATSFSDYGGGVWPTKLFMLSVLWLEDEPAPWVRVSTASQ